MRHKLKGGFVLLVAVLALGGLTAASALAAGAPVVETKPAISVTGTEATLNGIVEANGAAAKYYFEYGTTTGYGSKTAEAADLGKLEGHKRIVWLEPKTEYHFRIVATNSYGTSYGADQAFTTTTSLPEFSEGKPGYHIGVLSNNESGVSWSGSGSGFNCNSDHAEGAITGRKAISNATMVFQRCKIEQHECHNTKEVTEEIKTTALEGKLVYLSKTAKTVAILFKPVSGTTVATKVKCGILEGEVTGTILMPITPLNTLTEVFAMHGNGGAETYENELGEKLSAQMKSTLFSKELAPINWEFTNRLLTEAKIEVKA
jgi:hypothetical protein